MDRSQANRSIPKWNELCVLNVRPESIGEEMRIF